MLRINIVLFTLMATTVCLEPLTAAGRSDDSSDDETSRIPPIYARRRRSVSPKSRKAVAAAADNRDRDRERRDTSSLADTLASHVLTGNNDALVRLLADETKPSAKRDAILCIINKPHTSLHASLYYSPVSYLAKGSLPMTPLQYAVFVLMNLHLTRKAHQSKDYAYIVETLLTYGADPSSPKIYTAEPLLIFPHSPLFLTKIEYCWRHSLEGRASVVETWRLADISLAKKPLPAGAALDSLHKFAPWPDFLSDAPLTPEQSATLRPTPTNTLVCNIMNVLSGGAIDGLVDALAAVALK